MADMDFLPGVGDIIGGLFGVAGQVAGNKQAEKNIKLQNEYNFQLAKYAYDQNLDMWNRQNEYNTPLAQMQRLQEAGLNPNLMYGQGNVGNASNAPSFEAPKMEAYTNLGDYGMSQAGKQLSRALTDIAQVKNINANTQQTYQNTQNLATQNELKKLEIIYQLYENEEKGIHKENYRHLLESTLESLDKSIALTDSNINLNSARADNVVLDSARKSIMLDYTRDLVESEITKNLMHAGVSKAMIGKLHQDTSYVAALEGLAEISAGIKALEFEFSSDTLADRKKLVEFSKNIKSWEVSLKKYQANIERILSQHGVNLRMGGLPGAILSLGYKGDTVIESFFDKLVNDPYVKKVINKIFN